MKKTKLPKTDSIQKLAAFWDSHDLTDFEDELEEVTDPVLKRKSVIVLPLASGEVQAVEMLAHAQGVTREELIHAWVIQKLSVKNKSRVGKR